MYLHYATIFNSMLPISGVTNCIVIVVTPLMIDQREKFSSKGIVVDFVSDAQKDEELIQNPICSYFALVM